MSGKRRQALDAIAPLFSSEPAIELAVILDTKAGAWQFEWTDRGTGRRIAHGQLAPGAFVARFSVFVWRGEFQGIPHQDGCGMTAPSTRALLRRIRERFPESAGPLQVAVITERDLGPARAGVKYLVACPSGADPWKWLAVHPPARADAERRRPSGRRLGHCHLVDGRDHGLFTARRFS